MGPAGPKVVTYPDKAGEFRWRLVGGNGEIQASGEGHSTEEHALEAASTVGKNFAIVAGFDVSDGFPLRESFIERLTTEEAEGQGFFDDTAGVDESA